MSLSTSGLYCLSLHGALPFSPRPCLDWAYGLFLRTHRRGDRPARRRRVSAEPAGSADTRLRRAGRSDRKKTRLDSSHGWLSYAVLCLKKKKDGTQEQADDATP